MQIKSPSFKIQTGHVTFSCFLNIIMKKKKKTKRRKECKCSLKVHTNPETFSPPAQGQECRVNLFCRHANGAWEGLLKRPRTWYRDKPKNSLFPQEGLSIRTASFSAWLSSMDYDTGDPENTATWTIPNPLDSKPEEGNKPHPLTFTSAFSHGSDPVIKMWFGNYADGKCSMSDTSFNLSGSRVGGVESITAPLQTPSFWVWLPDIDGAHLLWTPQFLHL